MNPWRLVLALGAVAASCSPYGCARGAVSPIVPDSAVDGGCAFDQKVSNARLIRQPDGSALYIACPDASVP